MLVPPHLCEVGTTVPYLHGEQKVLTDGGLFVRTHTQPELPRVKERKGASSCHLQVNRVKGSSAFIFL